MQTSNQRRVTKLELAERQRLFSEYKVALDLLTETELESLVAYYGGPDFSQFTEAELEELANAETILPSLRDLRREVAQFQEWQIARQGGEKNGEKWTG